MVFGSGVRRTATDYLFIGGTRSKHVYIIVYVDDLLFIGERSSLKKVKAAFYTVLTVTDLGDFQHFLGICITRQSNVLLLSQPVYTERVLASTNMLDCKQADTSLTIGHTL